MAAAATEYQLTVRSSPRRVPSQSSTRPAAVLPQRVRHPERDPDHRQSWLFHPNSPQPRRQHAQRLPVDLVDDGGGEQQPADPPAQIRNDPLARGLGQGISISPAATRKSSHRSQQSKNRPQRAAEDAETRGVCRCSLNASSRTAYNDSHARSQRARRLAICLLNSVFFFFCRAASGRRPGPPAGPGAHSDAPAWKRRTLGHFQLRQYLPPHPQAARALERGPMDRQTSACGRPAGRRSTAGRANG